VARSPRQTALTPPPDKGSSLSGAPGAAVSAPVPRRGKLTNRLIEKAGPLATDYVIWDSTEHTPPGFGLRVWPARDGRPPRKAFILHYRAGGRERKLTLGRYGDLSVDAARKLAFAAKSSVAHGSDPAADKAKARHGLTLREAIPRFIEAVERKKKLRTAYEYKRVLTKYVAPTLGRRRLDDLDAADVNRLHEQYHKTRTQANRILTVLSSLCSWAAQAGLRSEGKVNPCSGVERYREEGKERFLTGEEIVRISDALVRAEREGLVPAPKRRMTRKTGATAKHRPKTADVPIPASPGTVNAIRLLMLTGARKNEVLRLRWADVDLERSEINLSDTKTGRSSRPIGAPAAQLLAELPHSGPYVFPGERTGKPIEGVRRLWDAVRYDAKLEDVRLHDLRHTMASTAAGEGLSLLLIGRMLGHKHAATTQRYAHLADAPVKAATDRTANVIAAFLEDGRKRAALARGQG
jgi:integrase